MNSLQFLLLS